MPDPVTIALSNIPDHVRDSVVGGARRVKLDIYDAGGGHVDPDKLTVKILNGRAGETTTWKLGTDAEIVKTDTGHFYVDLTYDSAGTWTLRAEASGELVGASERSWNVAPSLFEK